MSDFAPRENYDFAAAIREATIACTGLFTPAPAIVGETVCLITDPPSAHGGASSAPAQSPTSPARAGAAAVSRYCPSGRPTNRCTRMPGEPCEFIACAAVLEGEGGR